MPFFFFFYLFIYNKYKVSLYLYYYICTFLIMIVWIRFLILYIYKRSNKNIVHIETLKTQLSTLDREISFRVNGNLFLKGRELRRGNWGGGEERGSGWLGVDSFVKAESKLFS